MGVEIKIGDCRDVLKTMADQSVNCCVTSPPYFGLRDYGVADQIGLEPTPSEFVEALVGVMRDVRRVLRDDGTLWLNLGDSYCNTDKWGGGGGNVGKNTVAADGSVPSWESTRRKREAMPGLKPKDLIGIPWMTAFALRTDGWYLRSANVWHKPNAMPESVEDRTTSAYEMVFMLSKSARYFYDFEAIKEAETVPGWDDGSRTYGGVNKHGANLQHGERTTGRVAGPRKRGVPPRHAQYESSDQSGLDSVPRGEGRNKRNVWSIATQPFAEAHFATMAPKVAEVCIKAGSRPGDVVLDPFGGAGTTGLVADRLKRNAVLIELNPEYAEIARRRLSHDAGMFAEVV